MKDWYLKVIDIMQSNGILLRKTEICNFDKIFPCGRWHLTDSEKWHLSGRIEEGQ